MPGRDLLHHIVLKEGRCALVHIELNVRGRAQARVAGDLDALGLGVLDKGLLSQVGVQLDLEDFRADAGVAQQIDDKRALEVGDADGGSDTWESGIVRA
jgi:hypothetical protein